MKRASNRSPRSSKRHKANDDGSENSSATGTRRSLRGVPSALSSKGKMEDESEESEESEEQSEESEQGTESTTAELPEWLLSGLDELRKQYPQDSFHGIFNSDGEIRVICDDCPGTQYLPGESNTNNFALHLRNKKHRTNISTRLGLPLTTTSTPTASFKSRLHYESNLPSKLTTSTTSSPHPPSKESTPILPSSSRLSTSNSNGNGNGTTTPILPTSIPPIVNNTNFMTPTARLTQLEREGREREARIKELEGEVRRLGGLVGGLVEREKEREGKGGNGGGEGSVRRSGFGSFFGGWNS